MQAGGNFNNYQTVEYKDNLEKWFWTYFGYSYEKKKAFAYIKFASEEKTLIFSDIWHEIPKYFGVFLAKDPFYPACKFFYFLRFYLYLFFKYYFI